MSIFIEAAEELYVRRCERNRHDWEVHCLRYLLCHAVGRANAKPWAEIQEYLAKHDHRVLQTTFQQTLLKFTRSNESKVFIGSNDSNPKGYFLIEDEEDYKAAREFYVRRIQAQQKNLDHLDNIWETS